MSKLIGHLSPNVGSVSQCVPSAGGPRYLQEVLNLQEVLDLMSVSLLADFISMMKNARHKAFSENTQLLRIVA